MQVMRYRDLNPDLLKMNSVIILDDASEKMASGELTQLLTTIRHREIYVICLLHSFTFSRAESRTCMNTFRFVFWSFLIWIACFCSYLFVAANKQNSTVLKTIGNRYQIKEEIEAAYRDESKTNFRFILIDLQGRRYSVITNVLDVPIIYYKDWILSRLDSGNELHMLKHTRSAHVYPTNYFVMWVCFRVTLKNWSHATTYDDTHV